MRPYGLATRPLAVAVLFIGVNSSFAADVVFTAANAPSGELYTVRRGEVDSVHDVVTKRWGDPINVRTGTQIRMNLVLNPGETATRWRVVTAKLVGPSYPQDPSDVYWNAPSGWLTPNQVWDLPPVPSFVLDARLVGDIVLDQAGEGSMGSPFETMSASVPTYTRRSDVYITVGPPQYPMDYAPNASPPRWGNWASLLKWSTRWARFTSVEDHVAQEATLGFFYQRNPGSAYDYASRFFPANLSHFRLGDFLRIWNADPPGWTTVNCLDVSGVLSLAIASLGLDYKMRQLRSDPNGQGASNPLCPIGSDPTVSHTYQTYTWAWHSIVVPSGSSGHNTPVYDATAAHLRHLNGHFYRNPPAWRASGLHSSWRVGGFWQTPFYDEHGNLLGTRGVFAPPLQNTTSPVPINLLGGTPTDWRPYAIANPPIP